MNTPPLLAPLGTSWLIFSSFPHPSALLVHLRLPSPLTVGEGRFGRSEKKERTKHRTGRNHITHVDFPKSMNHVNHWEKNTSFGKYQLV